MKAGEVEADWGMTWLLDLVRVSGSPRQLIAMLDDSSAALSVSITRRITHRPPLSSATHTLSPSLYKGTALCS